MIPLLALIKVGAGLAALFAVRGLIVDPIYPWYFHLFHAAPFLAAGVLLIAGGRRDSRATDLGSFFLMAATAFVNRPLRQFVKARYPGAGLMEFLDVLELDAFMAFYLWRFARDFPHPLVSGSGQRRIRGAVLASCAAGSLFFCLNLLYFFTERVRGFEFLSRLVPMRAEGLYYGLLLPLTLSCFVFLFWRGFHVLGAEQRRVRLFLLGLTLAAGPPLIENVAGLIFPPYQAFKDARPTLQHVIISINMGFYLLVPSFLTPYAVLVHQVLDVRLLARRAAQYALARYTTILLAAVPIGVLIGYFYRHRRQTVVEIFSGPGLPLLATFTVVGVAALRYRKTLLNAIDRRFFREQYDARHILSLLLGRIRGTSGTAALASLIAREVDRALHLESVELLVLDPRSGVLGEPRQRSRRLDASSPLALLASDASEPLTIDLDDSHSPLAKLPDPDRHWLVDSGFKLIVPILARDGSLLGILGLGEKRSGLPFLNEDRELLRAIASSAAWVIELEHTRSGTPAPHSSRSRRPPGPAV
ncbi:MAG TPA: GAF domain-containing protein, partial [Thermoanaerobaculia bacterium]|nr:GAF domain-containing protein [Thermoanaerobaculia bacterium]